MAQERDPLNLQYCITTRCSYRHGNKCTLEACARSGNEKRASYYTKYNKLAKGDVPE